MSDDDQSRNSADQRTWIALVLMVFVALSLLGLMAMVAPHLLGVILVLGGLIFFGSAHYVIWGWWLPRYLKKYEEQDWDEASSQRKAHEQRP
jgi:hypothetical protein